MVERGEVASLALQARQLMAVRGEFVGEELERHVAAERRILRAPDHAHTAGADLLRQAVALELETGRSTVVMRDRRSVRNHLRSVHAVALANLVELTANVALSYSMPDDARFIVAGMELDYIKKAEILEPK